MTKPSFWKHGQKITLAILSDLSPYYFSDVIHRRRSVSPKMAIKLEAMSARLLGKSNSISRVCWVFNKTTRHPAFYGKPRKSY